MAGSLPLHLRSSFEIESPLAGSAQNQSSSARIEKDEDEAGRTDRKREKEGRREGERERERERWEEGDEFLWEIYGESCFPAAKLAFVGICVAKWAHVDARFRLDRLPIVVKPSEISRAENDFQTVRLEKYTVSTLRRYSSIILYVMPILKSAQRNLICFPFPFPFFSSLKK